MNFVEKLNKKLEPYYALMISLGFFATLLLGLYKFIFSPTDLKVNVQNEEMTYPSSIGKVYENIFENIPKDNQKIISDGVTIYSFLIKTTELKTITIENTSDKTLRDVSFKHLNTDAITAYSISSDFFNKDEEKKLYDNLVYDENRGITYLNQLVNIPSNKSIKIKLWGSFKKNLLENDIIVSNSEGDAFFDKSYVITGVKGYFVQYFFEFLVILISIFVVIYHYGLKYAINNSHKENT